MASVFLSYDRDDAAKAQGIALALETAGHSVWWDRHIKGGAQYSKEIEEALDRAEAVVVLWSEHSVESAWVRDEAAAGRDNGRLVPVRLDGTSPPLGFRQYQTIDFWRAKGTRRASRFHELLQAVEAVAPGTAGVARKPSTAILPGKRHGPHLGRSLIAALVAVAIIGAGFTIWALNRSPSIPTVAVAAANASPYVQDLARDLVTKLGRLQEANPDSLTLVGENQRATKANFILEVGGSIQGKQSQANLVLLTRGRRSILWSRDFQQPREKEFDLRQQVAVSGASVLDCAQEAVASDTVLDERTLKLYLNGCANLAEVYNYYAGVVIPVFLEVTRRAPRFKGGWAKLLLAEAEVAVNDSTPKGAATASALRRHVIVARALDPQMAEAFYADIQLLPGSAFERKVQIADKALALHPDNPSLLGLRADLLIGLGRMNEAVAQAKRAAELDALSPAARSSYIATLAYAGFTESALEELKKAENLWPGAGPLIDARFRLHARYGDPKIALEIMRSIPEPGIPALFEAFLLARIDPKPANIDRAIANASALAENSPGGIGILIQTLGQFGRNDQIYDAIKQSRGAEIEAINQPLFRPALRGFRRDPRFMLVASRFGLLAFWRKSGKWPDFCFEPDLPYDCKAEAAKLARQ